MTDTITVTAQELAQWEPGTYQYIDLRDKMSFQYGHLPGAVNLPFGENIGQE